MVATTNPCSSQKPRQSSSGFLWQWRGSHTLYYMRGAELRQPPPSEVEMALLVNAALANRDLQLRSW
jgi:hypothetical protein